MDNKETKKLLYIVYMYIASNNFWHSFKVMGVRLKVETIYVR